MNSWGLLGSEYADADNLQKEIGITVYAVWSCIHSAD